MDIGLAAVWVVLTNQGGVSSAIIPLARVYVGWDISAGVCNLRGMGQRVRVSEGSRVMKT
jgi:hypothetical protein